MSRPSKKNKKDRRHPKTEGGLAPISTKLWIQPASIESQVRKTSITRWDPSAYTLNWSSSTTVLNGWAFAISNLPSYTDLTSDYDYYRITRVDIVFYPQNLTGPTSGTAISLGVPVVWAVPDWSNIQSSTIAEIQKHEQAICKPAYQQWEMSIVPRASMATYSSSVSNGYMLGPPDGWFHTDSPNIQFYGFKTGLPQTSSGAVTNGVMYFRYHIDLMVGR